MVVVYEDSETSFTALLPSASCQDIMPNNTISNFRIPLQLNKKMPGPWHAALLGVGFPNNIVNLDNEKDTAIYFRGFKNPQSAAAEGQQLEKYSSIDFHLPTPTQFGSPDTFVESFNNCIGVERWVERTWRNLAFPERPAEPTYPQLVLTPVPDRPAGNINAYMNGRQLGRWIDAYNRHMAAIRENRARMRRHERITEQMEKEYETKLEAWVKEVARIDEWNRIPETEFFRGKVWRMGDLVECKFDKGSNRFQFMTKITEDDRFEVNNERKVLIFSEKLADIIGVDKKRMYVGVLSHDVTWREPMCLIEGACDPQVEEAGRRYIDAVPHLIVQHGIMSEDREVNTLERNMKVLDPAYNLADNYVAWADKPQVCKPHDMIYFHMDHIEPSLVGRTGVRMIGFSDVHVPPGEYQWVDNTNIVYKKVMDINMHDINIKTVDADNDQIHFGDSSGEVVCLVHFVNTGRRI